MMGQVDGEKQMNRGKRGTLKPGCSDAATHISEATLTPGPGLNPDLLGLFRRDLEAANWKVERVDSHLSPMALAALERDQLIPALVECRRWDSVASLLTRLFVLADTLSGKEVGRALPNLRVSGALALGLIVSATEGSSDSGRNVEEPGYRAAIDLRPHEAEIPVPETGEVVRQHWWIASDLGQAQTGLPPREDYVLGIASATLNLLRLTVRKRVQSALDLGCGCGILALYLKAHADEVVATDISPRACQFTRFNALLNEVDLDVRCGSLFEPVVGQSFDLITSNPPFVITPDSVRKRVNLEYRDGGMTRDNLVRTVITEGVKHLEPGGLLQILGNWEVGEDTSEWFAHPAQWIDEAAGPLVADGCAVRAWVAQRDLVDVAQYAEWWMRDAWGTQVAQRKWEREYREWLQDFSEADAHYVGLGTIAVQLAFEGDAGLASAFDDLTLAEAADGVAVQTALENLTLPENWLERALVRASDVREVRYFVPGSADPEILQLSQGRPGGSKRSVTSAVAALVGVSEGELTPGQVIPAVAELLGEDPEAVEAQILLALPELLRSGVVAFV